MSVSVARGARKRRSSLGDLRRDERRGGLSSSSSLEGGVGGAGPSGRGGLQMTGGPLSSSSPSSSSSLPFVGWSGGGDGPPRFLVGTRGGGGLGEPPPPPVESGPRPGGMPPSGSRADLRPASLRVGFAPLVDATKTGASPSAIDLESSGLREGIVVGVADSAPLPERHPAPSVLE
jgi:hypothetical protein